MLHTVEVPGQRVVDLSIICKPLSSVGGEAVDTKISTTEIAKRLQVEAVHPFFCDFRAEWSRTPAVKQAPGLLDMEEIDPWTGSIKLLLDITTGGLGPADVVVEDIKLDLIVSPQAGMRSPANATRHNSPKHLVV